MQSERSEAVKPCSYLGKCPRQREQQKQRPGSRGVLDLPEEQEDQRSYSGVRRDGEGMDKVKGQGEQVIVRLLLNELGKDCKF